MWRSCLHMPHLNYLPKGEGGGLPTAAAATAPQGVVSPGAAHGAVRRYRGRRRGGTKAAAQWRGERGKRGPVNGDATAAHRARNDGDARRRDGAGRKAARGRARGDGTGDATTEQGSRRRRHARRGSGMVTATAQQRRLGDATADGAVWGARRERVARGGDGTMATATACGNARQARGAARGARRPAARGRGGGKARESHRAPRVQ
uniref:EBNA-1 nuclear protein-like n=1 Tax=Oryza sativa subsp. japonica TaxID=39947 RepID=Q8GS42_ORYSJ|nr:EBNA-1 nuclear protein-like [Oryza sativa Japonica Group]BAC45059.1 EBNA-1 nuclear protein-like [Oryza sativa Japonica Group]